MDPLFHDLRSRLLVAACCVALAGCQTGKKTDATAPGDGAGESAVNVDLLVSMTWRDATKISAQHLEIPPYYKVAADEVRVLRSDEAGRPLRVRAKGHVFLQVDFREQLISLAQEAYIESNGEVILRGKPLLKRGRSLVEGLTDATVFYIRGSRLQVIGPHRLTKKQSGGEFPVQPGWSRSWKEGPNPLLPGLSPDALPRGLRANPMLPPPNPEDLPESLRERDSVTVPPDKPPASATQP